MSVKETPTANRFLAMKEKERAYQKHLQAVASAKATIDTSAPDVPNRLKVKSQMDAQYRKAVLKDYATRDRMVKQMKGEIPEFDDDFDEEEFMKKFAEKGELFDGEKESTENVKIGYTDEPIIEDSEPKPARKSKIPSPKKGSRIPVSKTRSPVKSNRVTISAPPVNSPVKQAEPEAEEDKVFETQNLSMSTSLKKSMKFEDDFVDDENEAEEHTPTASNEQFEDDFEQDFEDEAGVIPALKEDPEEPEQEETFDDMPDFDSSA